MTIRKLVRYGVGALVTLVLLGGVFAAWNINLIRMGGPIQVKSQQASDLVADILPPPAYILEAYLEATLLRGNPRAVDLHAARLAALRKDFETRTGFWRASDLESGISSGVTDRAYRPAALFWQELESSFLPAVRAGNTAVIERSYAKLTASYAEHRRQIDATVTAATAYQADLNAQGASRVTTAVILLTGLGGLVLVLVTGAGVIVLGKVVSPVNDIAIVTKTLAEGGQATVPHRDRVDELGEIARAVEQFRRAAADRASTDAAAAAEQEIVVDALVNALETLASGDLTTEIRFEFPPAYVRAKENFASAVSSLRHMIQRVVENAESIRTGTDEIAAASEDLARRTESNAASLEQTSAALVQIDGRFKTTTEGSRSTVARADKAIATVAGGRSTAAEAVEAMGRVSSSAKGIDSVIEGVDKIAFQTRVLAMNAAVEAGRAGDAGRGFAVVADLVSALAMRAEEEAKRARDQLTVTQSEIVSAVTSVHKVDTALAEISGDVGAVHGLLEIMASDNQAQSLAVTEITAAIASMDRATQQNAAMVEETSAATRTLTAEVSELSTAANAFKFERRVQDITPLKERRNPTGKMIAAKEAAPRPAARRASPASRPASALAIVSSNGGGDWDDF